MYYQGEKGYEPEVKMLLEASNFNLGINTRYIHERCWKQLLKFIESFTEQEIDEWADGQNHQKKYNHVRKIRLE